MILVSPQRRMRRMRWTAAGFVVGYGVAYSLQLLDLGHYEFEPLYETTRPRDLLAVLRFQHGFEAGFVLVALVGAILGFVASFAARRSSPIQRVT